MWVNASKDYWSEGGVGGFVSAEVVRKLYTDYNLLMPFNSFASFKDAFAKLRACIIDDWDKMNDLLSESLQDGLYHQTEALDNVGLPIPTDTPIPKDKIDELVDKINDDFSGMELVQEMAAIKISRCANKYTATVCFLDNMAMQEQHSCEGLHNFAYLIIQQATFVLQCYYSVEVIQNHYEQLTEKEAKILKNYLRSFDLKKSLANDPQAKFFIQDYEFAINF